MSGVEEQSPLNYANILRASCDANLRIRTCNFGLLFSPFPPSSLPHPASIHSYLPPLIHILSCNFPPSPPPLCVREQRGAFGVCGRAGVCVWGARADIEMLSQDVV